MFDKKKLNFWRLAVAYAGITITILYLQWSPPFKSKSAMMNTTMANMMRQMHASNLKIDDLLQNPRAPQKKAEMAGHHVDSPAYKMAVLTTSAVFLLLPLVIGGSIILAIIWIK